MNKSSTALPPALRPLAYWADRYAVSQATLRRMIANGELRAYRLGPRSLRVAEEDMAAAFEEANPAGRELRA